MTFLLPLALVASAIAALIWWAVLERAARPLVAVLIALLLLAPLQAAAGALDTFIASATPGVIELIGLALTGIIGWVAAAARRKWGIEIEARHREALHWALFTGAQLALKHELTGKAALDLILGYARQSVPDALGSLKPSPEVLTDLAKAKLEQVVAEKAKDATGEAVDRLSDALAKALGR